MNVTPVTGKSQGGKNSVYLEKTKLLPAQSILSSFVLALLPLWANLSSTSSILDGFSFGSPFPTALNPIMLVIYIKEHL